MSKNKLTIEEQYLTLEQAKELKALGIDFSKYTFTFTDRGVKDSAYVLTVNPEYVQYGSTAEYIPTLSVAEMIEMLPDYISVEHYFGKWHIDGASMNVQYPHVVSEKLLRDALFEMLKWLKQNKII